MRPRAHLDTSASQGQREAEQGKPMNRESSVSEEGAKWVEYGPLQRDVRVDAMKRLLAVTDWNSGVKRAFLDFAQHIADLSPIIRPEKMAGIVTLEERLKEAADSVPDEIERRALIYLNQAVTALKTLVRLETSLSETRELEQRDSLARAHQSLELASRASKLVNEESRRETLQMLCAWVETEVVTAERAIQRPDNSTAAPSE